MSITHELDPPNHTAILAPDFNPSPRLAEQIISDINAADSTLVTIARRANTTLESLCLWLTRPDIAARLQAVHTVRCICIQNKLAKYSDSMMDACNSILECYHNSASHLTFQDNDLRGHAILARKSSNALLAGRILIHLAKHFNPNPPRRRDRAPASPAPAPTPSPAPGPNPPPSPTDSNTDTLPALPRLSDPSIFNFSPSIFTVTLPVHPAPTPPTHNNAHTQPEPAPIPPTPEAPATTEPAAAPTPVSTTDIPHPISDIAPDPSHPRSFAANSPPNLRPQRSSAANSDPDPRCSAACTNCTCAPISHRAREPTPA